MDAVAETESAPGPEVSEEVSSGEEQEAVTKLSEPVEPEQEDDRPWSISQIPEEEDDDIIAQFERQNKTQAAEEDVFFQEEDEESPDVSPVQKKSYAYDRTIRPYEPKSLEDIFARMDRDVQAQVEKEIGTEQVGVNQSESGEPSAGDGEPFAEDGEQFTESGEQFTESGEPFAEDGEQTADDGEQFADDGGQSAEDGGQSAEDGEQTAESAEQNSPFAIASPEFAEDTEGEPAYSSENDTLEAQDNAPFEENNEEPYAGEEPELQDQEDFDIETDGMDGDYDDEVTEEEASEAESAVDFAKTAVVTTAGGTKPLEVHKIPNPWRAYNIPTDLLQAYEDNPYWIIDDETKQAAQNLKATLAEFKIEAEVTGIQKGPVVTMFELLPAPGVKLNRIVALQDNIALRLAASSVRIVAPIPGKHAVGIEVPNKTRAIISIRECLEQDRPEWKKMGVPVVLGKDIQGNTQIIDLVKTPHLLIAGATGAGKSVCVNSMILSILYKRSPNEVKMILIDPKIVELKLYNDIPHLLTPVITEPKKAMQALQYCLCEMERRYALLDGMAVREISAYNRKIEEKHIATERLPYLIVVIDEFADLMATTGKQLEGVLARLAAMSRAVGIHLVLATQRPSIDVITGLIKANIPSRIAFMVASKIDSRIILDQLGAEKLLGKGDMLYTSATDPFPARIQGTFVSDQEVENVVTKVKEWGEPEYIDEEIFVDDDDDEESDALSLFNPDAEDPLYEKAVDIVVQAGKASASYIQRRLKIGYNRAARLVEEMEEKGLVGPANGSKPREIIRMP